MFKKKTSRDDGRSATHYHLPDYQQCKRGIDALAAGLGLVLITPLSGLLALAIKLDSPGPVFFSQTRVGHCGRLFKCWKFRSMYTDAEKSRESLMHMNEMDGGTTFKIQQDPRITRVGRIIRKTSIDELPQLWNVLLGDMSLVGPRPSIPKEVDSYSAYDRQRLIVKPGITCIWQVSGRSNIAFYEQVSLDVRYILRRSFWLDLLLLLRTIPAVLRGRGAS
ncbi:MAG: lipopolysaccharide/colanic/teichoic acid biosynthesis glycosyltransferase [Patiriisocius sp.]|jgi:lipopolysaccharide/colanic/teichoic acid biosynthesis glycosyltransferase